MTNLAKQWLLETTHDRITQRFLFQQDAHIRQLGLSIPPLTNGEIREYAGKCYESLKNQIAKCKTDKDYTDLSKALVLRLRVIEGAVPEFVPPYEVVGQIQSDQRGRYYLNGIVYPTRFHGFLMDDADTPSPIKRKLNVAVKQVTVRGTTVRRVTVSVGSSGHKITFTMPMPTKKD